ncbi:MAG TPA: protease inhibitor I42 family protein [Burkholderiaceae bacterium]|nr:protease inhibitor I42 family protein [Burkholderiaceae bacterium]
MAAIQQTTPDSVARPRGAARRAALLVVAALAGCASWFPGERAAVSGISTPPGSNVRGMADLRDYRIALRPGERVDLRLPGNPVTGYRWTLVDPIPEIVRPQGVVRRDERAGLSAAPAVEVWTFEGVRGGVGQLQFEYRRPLDGPAAPPAQRASFRVEVR